MTNLGKLLERMGEDTGYNSRKTPRLCHYKNNDIELRQALEAKLRT